MKLIFKVCDRWPVKIGEKIVSEAKEYEDVEIEKIPHLSSLTKGNEKEIQEHNYVCLDLIEKVKEMGSGNSWKVIDFFGGSGFVSKITQKVLQPEAHLIIDYSTVCFKHLKRVFKDDKLVKVKQADSFDLMPYYDEYDLAICDFNTFTALRMIDENKVESAFQHLMKKGIPYIIFTDSAKSKLHLNKKVYQKILKYKVENFEDYMKGFSNWTEQNYDYTITDVNYHYGAATALLTNQVSQKEINFTEVGELIDE